MKSFSAKYARLYDQFYSAEKDYQKEVEFLVKVFETYRTKPIRHILDLACGTGGHAIPLSKREYCVDGVDASQAMIQIARQKAVRAQCNGNLHFYQGWMQEFEAQKKYDAIVCLFAAFDYISERKDVHKLLKVMKRALAPEGLVIIDFWNEAQFALHHEAWRVKDIQKGRMRFLRISETTHVRRRKTLNVKIKCMLLEGDRMVDHVQELHPMRYYSAADITRLFSNHGFDVLKISPFLKLSGNTKKPWVLNLVAKHAGSK